MSLMKDKIEMVEAKNIELVAKVTDFEKLIEAGKAKEIELSASLEKAIAEKLDVSNALEIASKTITESGTKQKELEAKIEALTVENEKNKMALGNPAYLDVTGQKAISGGDCKVIETGDLNEKLMSIKDPVERSAFYQKHFMKK